MSSYDEHDETRETGHWRMAGKGSDRAQQRQAGVRGAPSHFQRSARPHVFIRKFGPDRVCFRETAPRGEIPGVRKFSW